MKAFESLLMYPRQDKEYEKKSSLDIQRTKGNLYSQRPRDKKV